MCALMQHERARIIYKYALDHLPKARAQEMYQMYTQFEKQFGNREGIEDVVVSKRRFQYEEVREKTEINGKDTVER